MKIIWEQNIASSDKNSLTNSIKNEKFVYSSQNLNTDWAIPSLVETKFFRRKKGGEMEGSYLKVMS